MLSVLQLYLNVWTQQSGTEDTAEERKIERGGKRVWKWRRGSAEGGRVEGEIEIKKGWGESGGDGGRNGSGN